MKSVIASLIAVAGMSMAGNAAVNTTFTMQVSTDGTNFFDHVDVLPGTLVQIRAQVTYIGVATETRPVVVVTDPGDPDNGTPPTTGTELHTFTPRGLSSLVFQPTVSNWTGSDAMSPLVNGGAGSNTTTPSGVVLNSPGLYGRIRPWGRTALPGLVGFVHTGSSGGAPAGGWLRIAQTGISNWMGTGAGPNNVSGGSGINIAQLGSIGRGTADPAFSTALTNVSIFRFAVTVAAGNDSRPDLVIDAPLNGFGNLVDANNPNSDRQVTWWAVDRTNHPTLATGTNIPSDINEATGSFVGTANVVTAYIHVTPTPASLALLGLGGLIVGRRRR